MSLALALLRATFNSLLQFGRVLQSAAKFNSPFHAKTSATSFIAILRACWPVFPIGEIASRVICHRVCPIWIHRQWMLPTRFLNGKFERYVLIFTCTDEQPGTLPDASTLDYIAQSLLFLRASRISVYSASHDRMWQNIGTKVSIRRQHNQIEQNLRHRWLTNRRNSFFHTTADGWCTIEQGVSCPRRKDRRTGLTDRRGIWRKCGELVLAGLLASRGTCKSRRCPSPRPMVLNSGF